MKIGSVKHFTKIHDNLMATGKYDDIVTKGDDPKIAYQEKEIQALMEEKRVLNDLLTKQDQMIEEYMKPTGYNSPQSMTMNRYCQV